MYSDILWTCSLYSWIIALLMMGPQDDVSGSRNPNLLARLTSDIDIQRMISNNGGNSFPFVWHCHQGWIMRLWAQSG